MLLASSFVWMMNVHACFNMTHVRWQSKDGKKSKKDDDKDGKKKSSRRDKVPPRVCSSRWLVYARAHSSLYVCICNVRGITSNMNAPAHEPRGQKAILCARDKYATMHTQTCTTHIQVSCGTNTIAFFCMFDIHC
jgi:hypothetical protein